MLTGTDIAIETAPQVPVNEAEGYLARGLALATGRDGEVDYIEAHKWFSVAAQRGCREAALHRFEIAQEMSAADIARAQRAARAFLQLH